LITVFSSQRSLFEGSLTTSFIIDWFPLRSGTMDSFPWSTPSTRRFKTELAKQLMDIRKRYVDSGGTLLNQQDIENWTKNVRNR
jgi:hypothetical protein